jgi:hypothetical protein
METKPYKVYITGTGVSETKMDENNQPVKWARGICDNFKDPESGLPEEIFINFVGAVPTELGPIQVAQIAISKRPAVYDSDGVMTRPETRNLVVVR